MCQRLSKGDVDNLERIQHRCPNMTRDLGLAWLVRTSWDAGLFQMHEKGVSRFTASLQQLDEEL